MWMSLQTACSVARRSDPTVMLLPDSEDCDIKPVVLPGLDAQRKPPSRTSDFTRVSAERAGIWRRRIRKVATPHCSASPATSLCRLFEFFDVLLQAARTISFSQGLTLR